MKANFVEFNTSEKLDELFQNSYQEPVVLFKHSVTCPISANVFSEMSNVDSTVWVVVIQDARAVSNEIAEKTGIKHESPQALVIRDGKTVYHASHYDVTAHVVENILAGERVVL